MRAQAIIKTTVKPVREVVKNAIRQNGKKKAAERKLALEIVEIRNRPIGPIHIIPRTNNLGL